MSTEERNRHPLRVAPPRIKEDKKIYHSFTAASMTFTCSTEICAGGEPAEEPKWPAFTVPAITAITFFKMIFSSFDFFFF
uniref:Uncharacterized protein n=1 Tax=Anguilla anguilla TaxID=7936 RepID=A0A0E9WRG6_ANGAN